MEAGPLVENVSIGNGNGLGGAAQLVMSTESDGRFVMTNLAAGTATLSAFNRGSLITASFVNPITVSADVTDVSSTALAEPQFSLQRVDPIA